MCCMQVALQFNEPVPITGMISMYQSFLLCFAVSDLLNDLVALLKQKYKATHQNRSHFLSCLNCIPIMQPNVGPTSPPCRGRSLMPPGNKSMSSTVA
jgi:hypothetical protein